MVMAQCDTMQCIRAVKRQSTFTHAIRISRNMTVWFARSARKIKSINHLFWADTCNNRWGACHDCQTQMEDIRPRASSVLFCSWLMLDALRPPLLLLLLPVRLETAWLGVTTKSAHYTLSSQAWNCACDETFARTKQIYIWLAWPCPCSMHSAFRHVRSVNNKTLWISIKIHSLYIEQEVLYFSQLPRNQFISSHCKLSLWQRKNAMKFKRVESAKHERFTQSNLINVCAQH